MSDTDFAPPICLLDGAPAPCQSMSEPWPTCSVTDLTDFPVDALLIACTDEPDRIRTVCRAWPSVHVLAVCSTGAANGTLAEILEAGAEACVRDQQPTVIRAHLLAMARRAGWSRGQLEAAGGQS